MSTQITLKQVCRLLFVSLLCLFAGLLTYTDSDAHGNLFQATATESGDLGGATPITDLLPPCPSVAANGAAATVISATNLPPTTTPDNADVTVTPTQSEIGSGSLGVRVEPVEGCGVRVTEVLLSNSAFIGQLQAGDVIVAIDGQQLATLATGVTVPATATLVATAQIAPEGTSPVPMPTGATPAEGVPAPTNVPAETPVGQATAAGDTTGDSSPLTFAFFQTLQSQPAGTVVILTVQRSGQQFDIPITLGVAPSDMPTIAPTS